jgi:hypothetical protein
VVEERARVGVGRRVPGSFSIRLVSGFNLCVGSSACVLTSCAALKRLELRCPFGKSSVCRSRTEGAQRFDSSPSRGFLFQHEFASRRARCKLELSRALHTETRFTTKSPRKCAAKNFFIETKYSRVSTLPGRRWKGSQFYTRSG